MDHLRLSAPVGLLGSGRQAALQRRQLTLTQGEADLALVQHALGETNRHMRLVADARHDSQQMALLLDDFDALWEVLVVEERRELLHALIVEVGVDPQEGVLRIKTRDRGHDFPDAEPPAPDETAAAEAVAT